MVVYNITIVCAHDWTTGCSGKASINNLGRYSGTGYTEDETRDTLAGAVQVDAEQDIRITLHLFLFHSAASCWPSWDLFTCTKFAAVHPNRLRSR